MRLSRESHFKILGESATVVLAFLAFGQSVVEGDLEARS